jgi:hypothetical protein
MTGIYIDDTGTSGMKSKSNYDAIHKKTWIALILTPEQRQEAYIQMNGCVEEIKTRFNAKEFHFIDIYFLSHFMDVLSFAIRLVMCYWNLFDCY